jgi:hypothetical protein
VEGRRSPWPQPPPPPPPPEVEFTNMATEGVTCEPPRERRRPRWPSPSVVSSWVPAWVIAWVGVLREREARLCFCFVRVFRERFYSPSPLIYLLTMRSRNCWCNALGANSNSMPVCANNAYSPSDLDLSAFVAAILLGGGAAALGFGSHFIMGSTGGSLWDPSSGDPFVNMCVQAASRHQKLISVSLPPRMAWQVHQA